MLGTKIRQARMDKGINMVDFAKRLGTSQSAISLIERNKRTPNRQTLEKISQCLDLNCDELEQYKNNTQGRNVDNIDLIKAHKINTYIIESNLEGRCFICNKNLQVKGTQKNKYVLGCDCGLEILMPVDMME